MSELDTLDTTDSGPSIRDHAEAAVASHSVGPDIESLTNGAVEQDRAARHRDREKPVDHFQHAGDSSDQLRSTIRGAIHESKLKAASPPSQPAKSHEVSPGAPASWSLGARAAWDSLPQEVRLAVQREESEMMNGIEKNVVPRLREHAALDQVIGPRRAVFQQYGIRSDAEAVDRLFQWEAAIRSDPHGGLVQLAAQLGVDLRQLTGGAPQQYAQQYDPGADQQQQQTDMAVQQHLHQFSQGRPHFENVRYRMGELIRDHGERYFSREGAVDLNRAYADACREAGLGDNHARRAASVSPRSRAPAAARHARRHGWRGAPFALQRD